MPRSVPEINAALDLLYDGTPLVYGSGPVPCAIMLIGEAPGAKEIASGTPFSGQAGGNLETFLESLSLPRSDVYITNVCKFRPVRVREGKRRTVSNRTPTAAEVRKAVPFLVEEILCVNPRIVVTLGNTPLRAVTGERTLSVGDLHGTCSWRQEEPLLGRCLFALYHPASLIYNPGLRARYEEDIESLRRQLAQLDLLPAMA